MGKVVVEMAATLRAQLVEAAKLEWQMTPAARRSEWEAFLDGYVRGAAFTVQALADAGALKTV